MSTNDDFGYISSSSGDVSEFHRSSVGGDNGGCCATRRVVKSQCRTEEVEPGKFVRKCEKTEHIFKDCAGRPTEMVESSKELTEEDVTDQMVRGSFSSRLTEPEIFYFPGLHSDIETIERNFFGNINKFFEAAEELKNDFFNFVGAPGIFNKENLHHTEKVFPLRIPLQKKPVRMENLIFPAWQGMFE